MIGRVRRADVIAGGGSGPPERAPELVPAPGTPLYVHLPFCVAKCTYCDFFSVAAEGQDVAGTVDALLAEAERRAPRAPRTVFLGGGTPSLLAPDELARLFDGLDALTGFRASATEVTLEANPESLDLAKARLLRRLGVDRLSIGFQSLDPAVLELFGRVHSHEESLAAFAAARAAGFQRVNVDLIYAVPGQELAAWERDLERVLDLGPDHVSAYSLAFEPGTKMTSWLEEGRIERLPEERDLAFFKRTRRRLVARSYDAYELSNFALSGQQCQHNVNYWRNGPYLGLGPSAVSRIGATRFGNPRSVAAWRAAVERGDCAAVWEETPTAPERLGETWWLGLRTARGVQPGEARTMAGLVGSADPALGLAEELGRQGLLEVRDQRWRLSTRGLPLADAVARRFLEVCGEPAPSAEAAPGR